MNHNKIKYITVLMTTYNSAKYLSDSMRSILNQTYRNFEFLIIDDGSTDNSREVIESISDTRIRIERITHVGRSEALNYGLKSCRYDWVALMDADDISHPKRFEKQIDVIQENPEIDWISNWYSNFKYKLRGTIKVPELSHEIRNNLILSNSVCFASSLFKKKKIQNIGGFKKISFEDYDLLLRIKNNCNFYNIQEVLYYQRIRKKSISRNNFEETKKHIYKIQKPYYQNLRKEFALNSISTENYYKGWREFLFGSKMQARFYWKKLSFNVRLTPKVLIGVIISFFPSHLFRYLKKIGFKLVLFYSPFVNYKVQKEFRKNKISIS